MQVLVLDQMWQPSGIINIQKATLLLVTGRAVPVTDTSVGVMHSPSVEISVPSVIRIATAIKRAFNGHNSPDCSRARVMARDMRVCQFVVSGVPCKAKATTVDHLHPKSKGGQDSWENLVAACQRHNAMKKDRYLEEMAEKYHWSLKREPIAPRFMIKSLAQGKVAVHPEWEYFLSGLAS